MFMKGADSILDGKSHVSQMKSSLFPTVSFALCDVPSFTCEQAEKFFCLHAQAGLSRWQNFMDPKFHSHESFWNSLIQLYWKDFQRKIKNIGNEDVFIFQQYASKQLGFVQIGSKILQIACVHFKNYCNSKIEFVSLFGK